MDQLAIEAHELHKTYKKSVRALDGLSFEVRAGSIFALLGPNGAGKSTTVRVLTTLSRPDRGSARVGGIDVLAHPAQVRRRIGTVGQRPAGIGGLTGRENLELQGQLYGLERRALARRCDELLETFGLQQSALTSPS
jgi:ABC-2 type transport system ATP-binding protein